MASSKPRSPRRASTPASRPAARAASDAPPRVRVDRALKSAWQRQLARVQGASTRDARAFDEKYEAIAAIIAHDPPLYLAGGCATFRAFVDRYLHEDEKLVRMWVDVATHATPEDEAKYTPTRLAALLSYLRATRKDGDELPATIQWKRLVIAVPDGRRTTRLRAIDATVRQIRDATRAALGARGKRPPGEPAETTAARAVMRDTGFEEVSVAFHDGRFVFRGVPAYALRDFARAVNKIAAAPASNGRPARRHPRPRPSRAR